MLDENGNVIDLDVIDAIGQLPDGRFQVWLQNDRRLITSHPNALEIWQEHIRSKTSHISKPPVKVESAAS
jgi:hypothetical protein